MYFTPWGCARLGLDVLCDKADSTHLVAWVMIILSSAGLILYASNCFLSFVDFLFESVYLMVMIATLTFALQEVRGRPFLVSARFMARTFYNSGFDFNCRMLIARVEAHSTIPMLQQRTSALNAQVMALGPALSARVSALDELLKQIRDRVSYLELFSVPEAEFDALRAVVAANAAHPPLLLAAQGGQVAGAQAGIDAVTQDVEVLTAATSQTQRPLRRGGGRARPSGSCRC